MGKDQRQSNTKSKTVGILGSGAFATAIAQRLTQADYDVTIGSRCPYVTSTASKVCDLENARVTSVLDCIQTNEVIIVALHAEHFKTTFTPEIVSQCTGKILIDVSNRDAWQRPDLKHQSKSILENRPEPKEPSENSHTSSNAYLLSSLVPEARVVKAFNTLSAYTLECDAAGGSRRVLVASDDVSARAAVCNMARDMGLDAQEAGSLGNAAAMEESVLRVFPEWRLPGLVTLCVFGFWVVFALSRFYFTTPGITQWHQLPLKILNKVFGASTQTLLALTYFPSTCAALLQLLKGRKRGALPWWLITWLMARKQLGLLAFWLVCVHVIISCLVLSPAYMVSWFTTNSIVFTIPGNNTRDVVVNLGGAWMTWVGELSLFIGVLAVAMMAVLAVTSLPSVTSVLSWAEWRLVHSQVGYVMMTLAVAHVYVMGVPKWVKTGFPLVLFRVKFLSIVLPTLVILLRVVLLLPCLASKLDRVRKGWERRPPHAENTERNADKTAV